jgi:hypothetical protein
MSESPENAPLGDDLPMKWKLLGIMIFMRHFYKVAEPVVETAPIDGSTVNAVRAGVACRRDPVCRRGMPVLLGRDRMLGLALVIFALLPLAARHAQDLMRDGKASFSFRVDG